MKFNPIYVLTFFFVLSFSSIGNAEVWVLKNKDSFETYKCKKSAVSIIELVGASSSTDRLLVMGDCERLADLDINVKENELYQRKHRGVARLAGLGTAVVMGSISLVAGAVGVVTFVVYPPLGFTIGASAFLVGAVTPSAAVYVYKDALSYGILNESGMDREGMPFELQISRLDDGKKVALDDEEIIENLYTLKDKVEEYSAKDKAYREYLNNLDLTLSP